MGHHRATGHHTATPSIVKQDVTESVQLDYAPAEPLPTTDSNSKLRET